MVCAVCGREGPPDIQSHARVFAIDLAAAVRKNLARVPGAQVSVAPSRAPATFAGHRHPMP